MTEYGHTGERSAGSRQRDHHNTARGAGGTMSDTNGTLDAFRAELDRAREKHPNPNATLAALVEEVGELARAVADESRERVRAEAIQVGAMALRMIEDGDGTLSGWRAVRGLDALVEGEAADEREPDAWLVEMRTRRGEWIRIGHGGGFLWGDAESAREVEGREHTHRRVPVYFGAPAVQPSGEPKRCPYWYEDGGGQCTLPRGHRGPCEMPMDAPPKPEGGESDGVVLSVAPAPSREDTGVGRACTNCGVSWVRHPVDGCAKPEGERPVHNHGPEEGPGLACRESLIGDCLRFAVNAGVGREPNIEALAAAVHQAYLDTCARLGWSVKPDNQVPYEELSEASKELDRASVRAVLDGLRSTPAKPEGEEAPDPDVDRLRRLAAAVRMANEYADAMLRARAEGGE